MAIIVDKDKKRRDIALSCKDLLLECGIKDLTISQIAKQAGIGKGTIYEYFSNKEDIVFEIITSFIEDNETRLEQVSEMNISTKEKIFSFYFLFFDDEIYKKQLNIYKEYLAISMINPTKKMIDFSQKNCKKFNDISNKIIEEAISKGELKPESINIIRYLDIYHTGLVVEKQRRGINAKQEIRNLLDSLFVLLEENHD